CQGRSGTSSSDSRPASSLRQSRSVTRSPSSLTSGRATRGGRLPSGVAAPSGGERGRLLGATRVTTLGARRGQALKDVPTQPVEDRQVGDGETLEQLPHVAVVDRRGH